MTLTNVAALTTGANTDGIVTANGGTTTINGGSVATTADGSTGTEVTGTGSKLTASGVSVSTLGSGTLTVGPHKNDTFRAPIDPNFGGRGRVITDETGHYFSVP